jgi:hypothetical protein
MANITTRNSVLGVKAETTEGTLAYPAANTDYVKLQDDASITENKETLDNAELTGSIGMAEPIPGISTPAVSFSSYLKHSETEGQAPEAGPILKALFGSETVASTEYDTVAGSTVSIVNVDSGEGANYARGQALLVKDGVNGYAIRPIESISTDALTLGFDLSGAPASGVNLGKAVSYAPADSGFDTLSLHMYWGNGGLHQAVSGSRVLGYDITADAGQLINGSFTMEGISFYNNPIETTASTIYVDFTETGPVTHAVSVAVKSWSDPEALALAIQNAMNAAATADTFTVVYNSKGADAGKFTFTSDGSLFSILWNTGVNTANTIGATIGFSVGADDTGALTYTSDSALSWASPQTPSFDGSSPLTAKNQEVLFGDDSSDINCINPSTVSITINNEKASINDICALSGQSGSVVTARSQTIGFTAIIPQHCVENFARYRRNDTVRFAYMFGSKADGSNWDAGKCGCLYSPTCKITNIEVIDEDGIARLTAELQPFVSSGLGEFYLSFV